MRLALGLLRPISAAVTIEFGLRIAVHLALPVIMRTPAETREGHTFRTAMGTVPGTVPGVTRGMSF
jgi:hypothetical protein